MSEGGGREEGSEGWGEIGRRVPSVYCTGMQRSDKREKERSIVVLERF